MSGDISCELGVWLDSGVRNVPRGALQWHGVPRRVYTAAVAGHAPVATVRRNPYTRQWVVSMPGFVWDVRGERGSSTHQALRIEQSPARAFDSSRAARSAVDAAYACCAHADEKSTTRQEASSTLRGQHEPCAGIGHFAAA